MALRANKLNITDEKQFFEKEEEITKRKNVELFEKGMLNKLKAGHEDSLFKIHKYLFEEIYEDAGKLRTTDADKFTSAANLKAELERINKMPQKTQDEIIEKYIAINAAHPFAYGNGRVTRIWLDVITRKELKQTVDWSKISKDAFSMAIELSLANPIDIKSLINSALVAALDSREEYISSIDASFGYDGYNTYRTRFLG